MYRYKTPASWRDDPRAIYTWQLSDHLREADNPLSLTQNVIASYLALHFGTYETLQNLDLDELARNYGWTKPTLNRNLKALEAKGFIRLTRGNRKILRIHWLFDCRPNCKIDHLERIGFLEVEDE